MKRRFFALGPDDFGRASKAGLIVFLIAEVAVVAFVNLVVFRNGWLSGNVATLFGSLFMLVVTMSAALGFGKIGLRDVGVNWQAVVPGLLVTAGLWAFIQGGALIASLVMHGSVVMDPLWGTYGAYVVIGAFVAQIIGNALNEEVAMRGFLLTQVALRLRQKLTKGKALVVALLISQATFAVIHLPNRIYQHTPFTDFLIELPFLFLWGTMFAIVFYRTGSLFAAVGAHALMNAPTYLFDAGGLGTPIYLVGVVLLIILAPKLGLKRAKVADEPASPDAEAAVGS